MKQFRLAGQIREGGARDLGSTEYALLGDHVEARKRIAASPDFARQRPIFIAYCYGILGDTAQAAAWLEKAFQARDPQIIWLKVDPRFAKVRSDPRIAELIRKLGT